LTSQPMLGASMRAEGDEPPPDAGWRGRRHHTRRMIRYLEEMWRRSQP
jgi:hypothetical protein